MNGVVSPLRMNMTTTSGNSSQAAAPRRHRVRQASNQSQEDALLRQQVHGFAHPGYDGVKPQVQPGLRRTSSGPRHRQHTGTNQFQGRVYRTATSVASDEFYAGRPAMIAINPEDIPVASHERRGRVESHSRHRSQRPEPRSNSKSSANSKTSGTHGNCRGRTVSTGIVPNNRSRSISRDRAGTTATTSTATTSVNKPVRQAAPKPARQSAPKPVSKPVLEPPTVPEPVAWRVAVDPKSKRPYYYHPITRETTWKKPIELVDAEKREKRQFFSVMENNIRSKLKDGYWQRDSETSTASGQNTPRNSLYMKPQEMSPTRSSVSTVSCGSTRSSLSINSGRSLPGSARQMILNATRSLPTTPEGMGMMMHLGLGENQPQQEPETIVDRDSEDDMDPSKKRPSLFRTLSSYETPVMTAFRKGSGGVDVDEVGREAPIGIAVPSPIQERVRLASLAPRASDLEAYARAVRAANGKGRPSLQAPLVGVAASRGSSSSALMETRIPSSNGGPPSGRPRAMRRRSNSTNSIYLRMGTMNAPDQDATIECVATVLRAHMMEALEEPVRPDPRFDVFVTARDRQKMTSIADKPSIRVDNLDVGATTFVEDEDDEVILDVVPTLLEIAKFIKHVLSRAQMEAECIIMSLVYVERLLKATSGSLQLRGENWRRLVFCSMVMASKVWDDLSMTNADFSKIWPELTLKQINELELVYLSAVEYNVRVSAVSYAKYYFHLRSMCATMGLLEAFDESAPLNLEGARKMQVLSEEYQERSKLMPAPRRRSVTITTTSSVESVQANHGDASTNVPKRKTTTKASPAASIEQLVQMRVRVAGGSSLGSSMHRLSTSSTVKQ